MSHILTCVGTPCAAAVTAQHLQADFLPPPCQGQLLLLSSPMPGSGEDGYIFATRWFKANYGDRK